MLTNTQALNLSIGEHPEALTIGYGLETIPSDTVLPSPILLKASTTEALMNFGTNKSGMTTMVMVKMTGETLKILLDALGGTTVTKTKLGLVPVHRTIHSVVMKSETP